MLKYVCIRKEMSAEYFYHGGVLLVNASLSNQRILEIIKRHLDLKQDNCLNSKK